MLLQHFWDMAAAARGRRRSASPHISCRSEETRGLARCGAEVLLLALARASRRRDGLLLATHPGFRSPCPPHTAPQVLYMDAALRSTLCPLPRWTPAPPLLPLPLCSPSRARHRRRAALHAAPAAALHAGAPAGARGCAGRLVFWDRLCMLRWAPAPPPCACLVTRVPGG